KAPTHARDLRPRSTPTEVVVQRPGPVGIAPFESALRPLLLHYAIVRCDRAHVRCIAGQIQVAGLYRAHIRGLEERKRSFRLAARTQHPSALELEPHLCDRVRPRERRRLVE